MKQKKIQFDKLLKNYSSGWVGISPTFDSVVLHGKTLKEVTKKAEKLKEKVFFFPAGQSYNEFIGQTS